MSEVDLTETLRSAGALEDSAVDVMLAARATLVRVEMDLRDLWYGSVEIAPVLAARMNAAARFAHHAAEALSDKPLI